MRVLGYTWAGVRTADLKSTTLFFADVLGFSVIHKGEGLVQFEMPSGQLQGVVTISFMLAQFWAFQVEHLRAARKELESRGVEFVTDVDGNESEAWTYFRGPDGYLYDLWQTARSFNENPPYFN